MTKLEKIEWLRTADSEKLLDQFVRRLYEATHIFEISEIKGRSIEEIEEDYDLVRSEVLRRMGGQNA